jgi:ribosomal-protein-serine acetyltransferase
MTPNIRIRPYEPRDVDGVYEAVRESIAELSVWMPWCHANYAREETVAWVESRPQAWATKSEYSFVIERQDGQILGSCGLNRFDLQNSTANLGYWVRSPAARQGVATATVGLLQEWASANTELYRLEILASVENAASHRVAEKSGAIREAVLRERLLLHRRRHDAVLFVLFPK